MTRSSNFLAVVLAVAFVLHSHPGHADEVRNAVEAGNRAFIAAFLRGDAIAVAQLYTESER